MTSYFRGTILRLVILLALAGLVVSVACAKAPAPTPGAIRPLAATTPTPGVSEQTAPEERMIVRNATVSLVVEKITETVDRIAELAESLGGYVVSTNIRGEDVERTGTISFRVPMERFDEAVKSLRQLAVLVMSENTTSQDVTDEYVDLQSRLRNLEATEKSLLSIMQRSGTIQDVLNVQRELTNIQGQIEQSKGRMTYLERTSAMSLVTANLQLATSPKALTPKGWRASETVKSAVRAFTAFGRVVADFALWVFIFTPLWGAALIVWLVWRRFQARRK